MRTYTKRLYWSVEFTDPETGMVLEAGNETSFSALTLWVAAHLDQLPRGEGKFSKKLLKK